MCFHQFGPGTWPWALAPWPGPGPHNICTLGGWDQGPGPPKVDQHMPPTKSNKTRCVFTSLGLGPGPEPWPPGQALGLITFALWGGWDLALASFPRASLWFRRAFCSKSGLPARFAAKCCSEPQAGSGKAGQGQVPSPPKCKCYEALGLARGPRPRARVPRSLGTSAPLFAFQKLISKKSEFKIFKICLADLKIFKIFNFFA